MRIYLSAHSSAMVLASLAYAFFIYWLASDLAIEIISRVFIYRGGIYFHVYAALPVVILFLGFYGNGLIYKVILNVILAFSLSEIINKNIAIFFLLKEIEATHFAIAFLSVLTCIFLVYIFIYKNKDENSCAISASIYVGACFSYIPLFIHLLKSIYDLANP